MTKIKNTITKALIDKKTHMGYNEKNPTQPQGAFKADSMEGQVKPDKKKKIIIL